MQRAVFNFAAKRSAYTKSYYIDGHDKADVGKWVYSDKSSMTYR